MKKIELVLLLVVVLGAFLVRLYRIDNPVADWHSWRQADTSAVTRNFVKGGITLLHPKFDDLSPIPSGKENPQGFRFVEFPLYNAVAATMFNIFNKFSIEVWGRLVTIFSSLLSIVFLFLLVKKYLGVRMGLLSTFFFAFLPYNIYYSRTILPDPSMVMTVLGSLYFFDKWVEDEKGVANLLLAIIFTAGAFLLKPYALFFMIPHAYLAVKKFGFGNVKEWRLIILVAIVIFGIVNLSYLQFMLWLQWRINSITTLSIIILSITPFILWRFKKINLFIILSITPFILWRLWMQQYPEGIPASGWLFNENNIRFKGAFFYWIFADRIGRLILGYWGVALLVLGLIRKIEKKEGLFFWSFVASSLLYLIVMAGGNVKHDYYQILIVPTIAIFLARGADLLLSASKEYFSRVISYLLFVICCLAMLGFSWYFIRDYFNINNPTMVSAGKIVDRLTPKNAKVIAPYGGDSAFLYQTNRAGWPVFDRPIEKFKESGANYLIITNPTKSDFEGFGKILSIVASSKDYLLLAL